MLRLTLPEIQHFKKVAAEHEAWRNTMSAGLGQPEQEELYRLLGRMRSALADG